MLITNRWTGVTLYDIGEESLRDAVVRIVAQRQSLRDANLGGANLGGADLGGADLRAANLGQIKADLIAEVIKLPWELENLAAQIIAGKIDGSSYSGECACLAGTIGKHRAIDVNDGDEISDNGCVFHVDSSSIRERWFMGIRPGDTPDNSQISRITLKWVQEAIAIRDHIRATK